MSLKLEEKKSEIAAAEDVEQNMGEEADDENIKLAARNNAKVDAVNTLCEEIEKTRQKDVAWLPSQITLINKQISEPEFKLSIL